MANISQNSIRLLTILTTPLSKDILSGKSNKLDKLAPKFGREPIYTEQFHIIQALAYKMQEERANNPVEQSKEELKNLKIK